MKHSVLRVLLRLVEHRITADALISNHIVSLLASVLRPGESDGDGAASDNLSHSDMLRSLRALCFLADNEKSHEDMTQYVMPSLASLLTFLLSSLQRAWHAQYGGGDEEEEEEEEDERKKTAAAASAAAAGEGTSVADAAAGASADATAAADAAAADTEGVVPRSATATKDKGKDKDAEELGSVDAICESILLLLAIPQTVAAVSVDGDVLQTVLKRVTEFVGTILGNGIVKQCPAFVSRMFGELASSVRTYLNRKDSFPSFLLGAMVGQLFEHTNAGLLDVVPVGSGACAPCGREACGCSRFLFCVLRCAFCVFGYWAAGSFLCGRVVGWITLRGWLEKACAWGCCRLVDGEKMS